MAHSGSPGSRARVFIPGCASRLPHDAIKITLTGPDSLDLMDGTFRQIT